jgi:hypothetical protein
VNGEEAGRTGDVRGSMPPRQWVAAAAAVAAWGVLAIQLALTVGGALERGASVAAALVRLFSFFTILTNLIVAVVYTAHATTGGPRPRSGVAGPAFGAATALYITIVGVVYTLLLRPLYQPQGIDVFVNAMFHYIGPVAYLLFWLIFVRDGSLRSRDVVPWLAFPAAYAAYTMLRGAIVGWYPYPFLNVDDLGYGAVALNAAGLVLAFWAIGLAFTALDRRMSSGWRSRADPGAGAGDGR